MKGNCRKTVFLLPIMLWAGLLLCKPVNGLAQTQDSTAIEKPVAPRKAPVDTAGIAVRDSLGLFYIVDEQGYILQDSLGRDRIDSLRSWSPATLQNLRFLSRIGKAAADTVLLPLRDSLGQLARDEWGCYYQLDSLGLIRTDSLGYFVIDSIKTFTAKELKRIRRWERREAKRIADSIYKATPRMLASYAIDDSLRCKRMIAWTYDPYFNSIRMMPIDTGINNSFHDYVWLSKDVGANHLGISGSPTQLHNYFLREKRERFEFWDPHTAEGYVRENLPFYNSKSPYTLLAYAGTLFANKQKEEDNLDIRHNQNLSPETNFSVFYKRRGGRGLMDREDNDQRSFSLNFNHVGKKYVMHAGYLYNRVSRSENGGSSNDYFIHDTVVECRAIPITLRNAATGLKDNTLFISQSYGIPIRFSKRDSSAAGEGTAFFLGHDAEWNVLSRCYADQIAKEDTTARKFYRNRFYFHPTLTADSARLMRLDNKVFVTLQPWAKDAIVSRIQGGIGYEILHHYAFRPQYYMSGNRIHTAHNGYVYAGAGGSLRRYFHWDATGRYDLTGDYQNDFWIKANIRFSAYTRKLKGGMHLTGRFHTKQYSQDYFTQHYTSNHYIWDQEFEKTNDTRMEVGFSIPDWKLELGFSYGLLTNGIYYDTLSLPVQCKTPVNIMTATLRKDFRIWLFHFDNRILFQLSSNETVMPLPKLSANLRYYIQIPMVKQVCDMQIGIDATYYTAYYAQAYNPAIAKFHNQTEVKTGNNPYMDAFLNIKWKRATIFVKFTNCFQGWPESNYYSAPHYIRPQKAFKLGMSWPFHIKPGSENKSSTGGGGGIGRVSKPF